MNAREYLKGLNEHDPVWDTAEEYEYTEDQLINFAERYYEKQLKLLGIGVVSTRLKMGAKVYKKDKTITGFIDRKADRGFNHWIVIWNNGEQTKEYGSDLNVC